MHFLKDITLRITSAAANPRNRLSLIRKVNIQDQPVRNVADISEDFYTIEKVPVARTSLKYPREHTKDHLGMWYTIDPAMVNRLFQNEGITSKARGVHQAINETSFMIREPSLNVINYINKSDLNEPPNKFVLYGRDGTGKTSSLAHIIHHLAEENWVVVHSGVPARWCTMPKEILPSTTREGFYDHTVDATIWLQHFRQQNLVALSGPEHVTMESHKFTQRDIIEKGAPILSLVDFGIARTKYASECIFSLNTELKNLAREKRIKLGVVIDGLNTFFLNTSRFKMKGESTFVSRQKFTIIQAFKQLLQNDWKNGVIVGSVDIIMSLKDQRESYRPRYLLGQKGWDTLDPFVPILVSAYTDMEAESALNYYLDTKWLQHEGAKTREGKDEIIFLSGKNPGELAERVNYL